MVVGGCVVKCLYGDHVLNATPHPGQLQTIVKKVQHVRLIGIRKFNHHAIYCRKLIYVNICI